MTYPKIDGLEILYDKLKECDPDYDPNIRSKSNLKKMSLLMEFLSCPKHFSGYMLEYHLCGEVDCTICVRIGRTMKTPGIEVDG